VPLEAADWVPADEPEIPAVDPADASPPEPAPSGGLPRLPGGRREYPSGRLLIFLFQTNWEGTRLTGLMRMAIQARRFLDTLLPTDRVAILSFDSHLKLRQDFTSDRIKLEAAIDDAIRFGESDRDIRIEFPSLARHFDFRAAKRAVTPEKALAIISRAAAPIPGGKSMLFFGWGLGTIGGAGGPSPRDVMDYRDALPALSKARINIFTLDVTDADYHSLETSLERISDLTGGAYEKTHLFAGLAMERVRKAISGRYVLVFRKPDGPRGAHEISVKLVGTRGRVFARGYYED
jgi:VWFA-related protein